jgi:hypothetical protein
MEKIDFVYILRSDQRFNRGEEIKYSLRSVEKYCNPSNIFIVGGVPDFISQRKIILIKADDPYQNKLLNAKNKIMLACKNERVSDNFVLMNDDFFFLRPVNEIKNYSLGTILKMAETHKTKGGYYFKAINKTIERLKESGMDEPVSFEAHYPTVINKKKFLETISQFDINEPLLFRSIYHNLIGTKGVLTKDFKIYSASNFLKKREGEFISTDDGPAREEYFKNWIQKKFPAKSRYEKEFERVLLCQRDFCYNGIEYKAGQILKDLLPNDVMRENQLIWVLQEK